MEEKKTDWKTILGMTLIFAILMYTFVYNNEPEQPVDQEAEVAQVEEEPVKTAAIDSVTQVSDSTFIPQPAAGQEVQLSNDLLDLKFNTKGAYVTEALLKKFHTYDSLPVYLAKENDHSFDLILTAKDGRKIHTKDLVFTPTQSTNGANKVLSMKAPVGSGSIEYRYEMEPGDYMLDFTIRTQGVSSVVNSSENAVLDWQMKAYRRSKSMTNENRYTEIKFEYDGGSDDYTGQGESAEEEEENITYVAYKQHFFSSILLTDTPFASGVLKSKNIEEINEEQDTFTKEFESELQMEYSGGELAYNMNWYFGPTDFDILNGYERNLDEVVDLGWGIFGWINQYAIRPLFSFLTVDLGIAFGIAIILLTICVRLVLSPVLYKSYLTQAKMKILRPEINRIAEKYKDNAMKKQQETMKVQSEAGASPLSGCLPALLQMPVFFALFKFFPTAFDLRQKSFLWANDLSSYDTIYKFPEGFDIPFYGDHVSLFPILASISIFFYMQMTTGQSMQTPQPGMPNMKFIMYLSPLFMLVFFNNYASGLSLYYFVSNLITIGIMLVIKNFIIDKDRVLAKIEKAKAKPKKKGGFATKMQKIMEQAQAQQEAQKKGK
ncbi:membrane protein insertase YidC [Nonlabens marinus]|uniref:Membrane protein insertase YidC n=1 Tax=Nonlabens marinus S1-08 TaxID=1454201 RepID=W8VXZ6_9FLAO|nr:membrane protein insertase YidC [Nonlabens marinus]BAO56792.1 inner membrane protein translocase component YidC, long form [Nonlabens marinus S1-08]